MKLFPFFLYPSFVFLTTSLFPFIPADYSFPDFFDALMYNKQEAREFLKCIRRNKHVKRYKSELSIFNHLYNKSVEAPLQKNTIPRIIHQIWLGGSLPDKYKHAAEQWAALEGWDYKLWTDKEVATYPLINQILYDKASNYGEKSDILRYEILYNEGGLYIDTDCVLVSNEFFEYAHDHFDFYIGLEPLNHSIAWKKTFILGNAVIGSIPAHPFLSSVIQSLTSSVDGSVEGILERTGPFYLTKQFDNYYRYQKDGLINMILPPVFFYPFNYYEAQSRVNLLQYVSPLSPCYHLWDSSWVGY